MAEEEKVSEREEKGDMMIVCTSVVMESSLDKKVMLLCDNRAIES